MRPTVDMPFWRGSAPLPAWAAAALTGLDARAPARRLVVEVGGSNDDWLVLLATTADDGEQAPLHTLMGFASRADRVDRLRELGFAFVETRIVARETAPGVLGFEVADPLAVAAAEPWLRIHGVRLGGPGPLHDEITRFEHELQGPAPEDPANTQLARRIAVSSERRVSMPQAGVDASIELPRLGMAAMPEPLARGLALPRAQHGRLRWPDPWQQALPPAPEPRPEQLSPPGVVRRPRTPLMAATGYRFTGVEIVGFRIELGERPGAADVLGQLVEPLNFHRHEQGRRQGWGLQAFRYRPAAPVLVVELLRYGRMYWGEEPPYPGEPWTAQHELLVRLLVGRVDDHSAQARDPALFVPAIFVDNGWSRWVGRELQGYDKQLAGFHTALGPLDLRGCLSGKTKPEPLTAVTSVRSRSAAAAGQPGGDELLGITLPPGADDEPLWIDVDLLMGSGGELRHARWRQADFVDPLFRRGFAGDALQLDPARTESIQASPIDRRELPRAWIPSTMVFDRMQAAQPEGLATLNWRGEAGPPAWRLIASLFPEREVDLTTGAWYRARGDLRMLPA